MTIYLLIQGYLPATTERVVHSIHSIHDVDGRKKTDEARTTEVPYNKGR